MPNHSRNSSSASSVGSSYVSSTDSNKTSSPSIESPTPPHSNHSHTNNAFETNMNFVNSQMHSAQATLPRYQNTYNALINELNHANEQHCFDKLDGAIDKKSDASNSDTETHKVDSIYGSIRPQPDKGQTNGSANDPNGFTYKTLNGGVIRSVHPPGKGNSCTYKVSVLTC